MNCKNFIFTLMLLVATWMWSIPSTLAYSSYYVYDQWGGTYYDAEKSQENSEDDLMCWAASASNILAWTGWGEKYSTNADTIFAYFQSHWTDGGGSAYVGWDWWFDGTSLTQSSSYAAAGWSQVDVAGGGFWTGYSFSNYFWGTSDDSSATLAIKSLLTSGYGVSLGVTTGSSGHAITCWGYQYDDQGNIVGIYVTDSDDSKSSDNPSDILQYYTVSYSNGEWYLEDFYNSDSWYITEVLGLKLCSVPEPATILLLGFGLFCLAVFKLKIIDKNFLFGKQKKASAKDR